MTAAFRLRRPALTDVDGAIAIHCDPATNVFKPGGAPTEAQVREYLPLWLAHWDAHGFGYWTVERDDGEIVGFGGIMQKAVGRHFGLNLYFRLRPDVWGSGLASRIGRESLREAFEVRDFDRVLGLVRPHNLPSRRALERLGMVQFDTVDDVPGEPLSLIYEITAARARGG